MILEHIHIRDLFDGTGNPIQKNIVLIVENNRINAIIPFHETYRNKITQDLSNHTIFPYLADAHVHLAMSGTLNLKDRHKQLSMNFDQAKNQIKKHLDQYAKAGIKIVRDGGDRFGHTFQFKKLFNHGVEILSPEMAWYRTGRYGQFAGKSIDSTDDSLKIISSQHQGNHIKIIQSGINSVREFAKETSPQFSLKELTSICQWGNQRNRPVMVHANGIQAVKIAIDAGCTSIEHGYFMGEDNLKKMADKQIFWVPTLIPMFKLAQNLSKPEEKDIALRTFDMQCEMVSKAINWRVPIAIGSDSGSFGVDHVQGLFDEMKLMMTCGFSFSQVIQCCTTSCRQLFRYSDAGLIKQGEMAQFIAVESTPISLENNISKLPNSKINIIFFGDVRAKKNVRLYRNVPDECLKNHQSEILGAIVEKKT